MPPSPEILALPTLDGFLKFIESDLEKPLQKHSKRGDKYKPRNVANNLTVGSEIGPAFFLKTYNVNILSFVIQNLTQYIHWKS